MSKKSELKKKFNEINKKREFFILSILMEKSIIGKFIGQWEIVLRF